MKIIKIFNGNMENYVICIENRKDKGRDSGRELWIICVMI